MVIASHGIFSAYGFWLPNDPRASWSEFVRQWELFRAGGPATKTDDPRSLAKRPHDPELRRATKARLMYEPVEFTGLQARAIARGFARAVEESSYQIRACAIMPDHVHIVLLRHERAAERIIGHLKTRATQQLVAEGLHPFAQFVKNGRFPSVWAHRAWKVFLDNEDDVERAIDYVNQNPIKVRMKAQNWNFVSDCVS
jgi:REP element-mobilizing transposase RayT